MDKLIIKIGADMKKELREAFENPEKVERNTHTLFLRNAEELYKLLSPKRLELLSHIIKQQSEKKTISEMAKQLKRKQEAISRDANILAKHEMIKKTKEKQKVYLKASYNSLDILLGN